MFGLPSYDMRHKSLKFFRCNLPGSLPGPDQSYRGEDSGSWAEDGPGLLSAESGLLPYGLPSHCLLTGQCKEVRAARHSIH